VSKKKPGLNNRDPGTPEIVNNTFPGEFTLPCNSGTQTKTNTLASV
jgi:hypothetical protein